MKITDLIPGERYKATCFDGNECIFVEVVQECADGSALIVVQYGGQFYLASIDHLYR